MLNSYYIFVLGLMIYKLTTFQLKGNKEVHKS